MKKYSFVVLLASLIALPVVSNAAPQYSAHKVSMETIHQQEKNQVNSPNSCYNTMMKSYMHQQCNDQTNYGTRSQMDACMESMVNACHRLNK